jgi:hypothetical protein
LQGSKTRCGRNLKKRADFLLIGFCGFLFEQQRLHGEYFFRQFGVPEGHVFYDGGFQIVEDMKEMRLVDRVVHAGEQGIGENFRAVALQIGCAVGQAGEHLNFNGFWFSLAERILLLCLSEDVIKIFQRVVVAGIDAVFAAEPLAERRRQRLTVELAGRIALKEAGKGHRHVAVFRTDQVAPEIG